MTCYRCFTRRWLRVIFAGQLGGQATSYSGSCHGCCSWSRMQCSSSVDPRNWAGIPCTEMVSESVEFLCVPMHAAYCWSFHILMLYSLYSPLVPIQNLAVSTCIACYAELYIKLLGWRWLMLAESLVIWTLVLLNLLIQAFKNPKQLPWLL